SAGIRSTRVDCSAGARPKSTPVIRESAAATPRTCQFSSARKVKFVRPLASRSVRKRIPQLANITPKAPPSDARPAGPQAEPQRDFPPSRRGARQQQIGDVGARQSQDQSNQRHQHEKWLRILAAQAVEAPRAFFDHKLRKIRALAGIRSGAFYPLPKRRRQRGLRLRDADARTQPAHDVEPIVISLEVILGAKAKLLAGPQQFIGV